jgi:hypothetical protein
MSSDGSQLQLFLLFRSSRDLMCIVLGASLSNFPVGSHRPQRVAMQAIEFRIESPVRQQFLMAAAFDDAAFFHHDNAIGDTQS